MHFCTPRNENEKTNIGALEHGHQDLGRLIDKWQTMAARRAQKVDVSQKVNDLLKSNTNSRIIIRNLEI